MAATTYRRDAVADLNRAQERLEAMSRSERAVVWAAALNRMNRDPDYTMLGAIEDAIDFDRPSFGS